MDGNDDFQAFFPCKDSKIIQLKAFLSKAQIFAKYREVYYLVTCHITGDYTTQFFQIIMGLQSHRIPHKTGRGIPIYMNGLNLWDKFR